MELLVKNIGKSGGTLIYHYHQAIFLNSQATPWLLFDLPPTTIKNYKFYFDKQFKAL